MWTTFAETQYFITSRTVSFTHSTYVQALNGAIGGGQYQCNLTTGQPILADVAYNPLTDFSSCSLVNGGFSAGSLSLTYNLDTLYSLSGFNGRCQVFYGLLGSSPSPPLTSDPLSVGGRVFIRLGDPDCELGVTCNAVSLAGNCDAILGSSAEIQFSPLDFSFVDPDGSENTVLDFQFASGNEDGYFSINSATGQITLIRSIDRDVGPESFLLVVRISDGIFNSTYNVSVAVLDNNDNPPRPTQPSFSASIEEGLPRFSSVLTVDFTDADEGDNARLTYSLDASETNFVINNETGEVLTNREFDYEAGDLSITFTVTAVDGGIPQQNGTVEVTVTIVDENDNRPEISVTLVEGAVYVEDEMAVRVANVTVTDLDTNFNLLFATVTITDALDVEEVITATVPTGLKSAFANYSLYIVGGVSTTEMATILQSSNYANSAEEFSPPLNRTIEYSVCDQFANSNTLSSLSPDTQYAISYGNASDPNLPASDIAVLSTACQQFESASVVLPLMEVNDRPEIVDPNIEFDPIPEGISDEENLGQFVLSTFQNAIVDPDSNGFLGLAIVDHESIGIFQSGSFATGSTCENTYNTVFETCSSLESIPLSQYNIISCQVTENDYIFYFNDPSSPSMILVRQCSIGQRRRQASSEVIEVELVLGTGLRFDLTRVFTEMAEIELSFTNIDVQHFTEFTRGNGTYYFTFNDNTTVTLPLDPAKVDYTDIGVVSDTSALVLGPYNLIRFVPFEFEFGTAQLQFKAWDGTDGIAPETTGVDTTSSASFSADTGNATIVVIAVNNLPEIELGGPGVSNFTTMYTENGASSFITASNARVIERDPRDIVLSDLRVFITNEDGGCDLTDYTGISEDRLSYLNETLIPMMSVSMTTFGQACTTYMFNGTLTLNQWSSYIRMIRFFVTNNEPSDHRRRLAFVISDNSTDSLPSYTFIDVALVSDICPELELAASSPIMYTEHSGPIVLDSGLLVTDGDGNPEIQRALVSIMASDPCAHCILTSNLSDPAITTNYSSSSQTLILEGPASPSVFQTILRGVQFEDTGDEPAVDFLTIQFQLIDPSLPSATCTDDTRDIIVIIEHVNDNSPVIFLNWPSGNQNFSTTFTEGEARIPTTGMVMIVEPDAEESTSYTITVQIDECMSSEDVLEFMTPGATTVTQVYDAADCFLELNGTITDLESDLNLLRYRNTNADNPSAGVRTLNFTIMDPGVPATSSFSFITVIAINDPPEVDLDVANIFSSDSMVQFELGTTTSVSITGEVSGGSISDPDNTVLQSMTLSLAVYDSSDTSVALSALESIQLSDDNILTDLGLTPTHTSTTLTITGTASVSDYVSVLNEVVYENTQLLPSMNRREVSVTVNDGTDGSEAAVAMITIRGSRDPPIVDLNGNAAGHDASVSYTFTTSAIDMFPSGTVTDPNEDNICQLQVTLVGSTDTCPSNSIMFSTGFGDISVDEETTGDTTIYTVTTSFTECRQNIIFESVLRGMMFRSDGTTPGNCSLSVVAMDESTLNSTAAMATIEVRAYNDPPFVDLDLGLTGRDYSTVYFQGGRLRHIVSIFNANTSHNITSMTVIGEADGEAGTDGTVDGGVVIEEQSDAGYVVRDADSDTLSYLQAEFILSSNPDNDVIRYPCVSASSPDPQGCTTAGQSFTYTDLSCDDSVFDACSAPVDLCTDLTVNVFCSTSGSKAYRFTYLTNGTVDRYEALLGYLGYDYLLMEGGNINETRLIDISVSDGESTNLEAITRVRIVSLGLVIPIDPPPPAVTFNVYEDERPNRTRSVYTVPVERLDGTVPDPGTVEFSITNGNTGNAFTIDSTTGEIFLNRMVDRETIASYTLEVTAHLVGTDQDTTATAEVIARVIDINDNHPITAESYTVNVTEGMADATVVEIVATDADEGTNAELNYLLLGIGVENFYVDDDGVVRTSTPLNVSIEDYYLLVMIITDRGDPYLSTHTVIHISVITPPPTNLSFVASTVDTPVSVFEDLAVGSVFHTVEAFEVDGTGDTSFIRYRILSTTPAEATPPFAVNLMTGEVSVNAALDSERNSRYEVLLQAYSVRNLFPPSPDEATLVVNVNDVNEEEPMFPGAPLTFTVEENSAIGTLVGTLNATDNDDMNLGITYSLHPSSPASLPFTVESDGDIVVSGMIDYEQNMLFVFTVQAQDDPSHSMTPRTGSAEVRVTVIDRNDNQPVFLNTPYEAAVRETAANDTVVLTFNTTDADSPDNSVVSYSSPDISGTPFCLVETSVQVCNAAQLTAIENPMTFSITIVATNPPDEVGDATRMASETATINLTLINEFDPVFANDDVILPAFMEEHCGRGDGSSCIGIELYDFNATDSDGGVSGDIQYNLVTANVPFIVDSTTGVLSVTGRVDREDEDSYLLQVVAVDGADVDGTVRSSTANITITVTDINDNPPTIIPPLAFTVTENMTRTMTPFGSISILDPDITGTHEYQIVTPGGEDQIGCVVPPVASRNSSEYLPIEVITNTGELFFCQSIDFEMDRQEFEFNVTVVDSGNLDPTTPVVYVVQSTITVTIVDFNDNPPVIEEDMYAFSVAENRASGTSVGTVTATDEDSGLFGNLSFSLSYNGSSVCSSALPFEIFKTSFTTADIRTCMELNYEERQSYSFDLDVCDGAPVPMCDTASVTVQVVDQNDNPPAFTLATYTAEIEETDTSMNNTFVVQVVVSDDDSAQNSISIFSIVSSGSPFGLRSETALTADVFVEQPSLIDYDAGIRDYTFMVLALNEPSDPADEMQNATATVVVTITDVNDNAPVISAPFEFEIRENEPDDTPVGCISASDADSGNNAVLSYYIADAVGVVSCTADTPFSINVTTGCISTCEALDYEAVSSYTFTVRVCDGGNPVLCSNRSITVDIIDLNDNPLVFTEDPFIIDVNENTPALQTVLTITSTDADSDINSNVTYSFVNTTAPFTIRNEADIYYTGDEPLNFETGPITYILNVRGTNPPAVSGDMTWIVDVVVTINIIDRNDHPPVFDPVLDTIVTAEHPPVGTVLYTLSTSDLDTAPNSEVTYSIVNSSPFTVNGTRVEVADSNAIDFDPPLQESQFVLTIQALNEPAMANDITQTANFTLYVNVTDINDNAPQCLGLDTFTVPEDAEVGITVQRYMSTDIDSGQNGVPGLMYFLDGDEMIGSASGSGDPVCTFDDPFRVHMDTGDIYPCVPLDYERTTLYRVNVTICDSGMPRFCTDCPVEIFIMDVNDNAPVFNPPTEFSVAETVPITTQVGCINGTDVDTGDNGVISYDIVETECVADNPFQINSTTGCITVCQLLDFEAETNYTFTVVLTDNAPPFFSVNDTITILIENENDHTPVITSPNVANVVEEETGAVVIQVTAEDIDAPPYNSILFSLTDDAGGLFEINSITGVVTTTAALNRESIPSYGVVVQVSDGDLSSEQNLTIFLVDINDNLPVYQGNATYSFLEETLFSVVLVFSDEDTPANSNHTFNVSSELFQINEMGLLSNTEPLDRDPATGGQPSITITVTVFDGDNQVQIDITIVLLDVNDNAPVALPPFEADIVDGTPEGASVLTIAATDADEGDNARLVFIIDGTSDTFAINSTTGVVTVLQNISLDASMAEQLSLMVNISDSGIDRQVITRQYTFHVVSSLPIFDQDVYTFDITENELGGLISTITAMDRDIDSTNDIFEYSILSVTPYDSGFTIESRNDTAFIYRPEQYFDFEDSMQFNLTVAVGRFNMTTSSDTTTVQVNVIDSNDNPPRLSPLNINATLPENAANGYTVEKAVGIDFDRGRNGMLSYNHSGYGAEVFAFDSSGNFLVTNSLLLDFETNMSFTFSYQACDDGIPQLCSEPGVISITVTNVDDLPPVFDPPTYTETIAEDFGLNRVILTVQFTDPDTPATDVQLYLSPPQTLFEIVQISGALMTTNIPLDRESSMSHSFSVIANDTSGQMATASILIQLSDVNDVRPRVDPLQSAASFNESGGAARIASSLSVVDEDDLNLFPLSRIDISLHPSPESSESYPLAGGLCDHANYSILYDDNVYNLCGVTPSCTYLLEPENFGVTGGELADRILTIESPSGFARNLVSFPESNFQSFSVSAWLRLDDTSASGPLIQLRTTQHFEIELAVNAPSGGTGMGTLTVLSRRTPVFTTGEVSTHDNQWHQITLVRNGDDFTIYFDAREVADVNTTGQFDNLYTSDASFLFGVGLEGYFAEVYVCFSSISPEVVQCTMTCGESLDIQSPTENVTATTDLRTRSVSLVYTGDNPTASQTQLEEALRKLVYINDDLVNEPHPLSRGVFISIYDSVGPSDERGVITLTPDLINDQKPVLDLNGLSEDGINFATTFNELSSGVRIIGDNAALYDEDSGFFTMSRIEIEIISPTTIEELFVSGTVDGLVITRESNSRVVIQSSTSVEHYPGLFLDALRAVLYQDLQDEPTQADRDIQFTVYDMGGNFVNSPLPITTVTVVPTNDIPVLDLDTLSTATRNTSVTYIEEDGEVRLLSGVSQSITDPDSSSVSMAIVQFTVRSDGESESLRLDTDGLVVAVMESYNSSTGTLTLSGTYNFATWLDILRRVEYVNTFGNPDEDIVRQVSMQVEDDSGGLSQPAYVDISVTLFNDPPEVFLGGPGETNFNTEFVEDGPCVPIANVSMELIDIDSPQLLFVQVSLESTNVDPNTESLMILRQDPPGTYNSIRDRVIIRLTNTTPENYQLALPNIAYCNTADEPNDGQRTIEVTADDAGLPFSGGTLPRAESDPAFTFIEIVRVNDRPVLEIQQLNNVSIRGVPTPIIDPDSIVLEDSDDDFFSSLYIFISNDEDGAQNEIIEFATTLPLGTTSIGPTVTEDGEIFYNVTFRDDGADITRVTETVSNIRYNNRAENITVDPPRIICIQVADMSDLFSELVCVNVTISPPNDASPVFLNTSSSLVFNYDETESPVTIGRLIATDADTGLAGQIAYSITEVVSTPEGGTEEDTTFSGMFEIDEETGDLSAPLGLDAEDYTRHVITVTAADMGNPVDSSTVDVTITITDSNDNAPVFTGVPYIAPSQIEGLTPPRDVLRVEAEDNDVTSTNNGITRYFLDPEDARFSINSITGQIQYVELLHAEDQNEFTLTVGAEDSGNPTQTGYATVLFELIDVNDNAAEVDQVASPAIYVIEDPPRPQSIGPAIRIADNDRLDSSISSLSVKLTVNQQDQQREYSTCLAVCQPARIADAGLTSSINLIESATFTTDDTNADGVQFLLLGDGDCDTVRLSRGSERAQDGYGRITRSDLPSDFGSGDFSVSFVTKVTNEGFIFIVPDQTNTNLPSDDVERDLALWFRRRDLRFYYVYGSSRTRDTIIYRLPPDEEFFDPAVSIEDAITRHYTVVVRSSTLEIEFYVDCNLVFSDDLDGEVLAPTDNIDVFIGQSRPSPVNSGRLGAELHGLYYHPQALSASEVTDVCSCGFETINIPSSLPSTISGGKVTDTNGDVTLSFVPTTSSVIPEEDIVTVLRGILYENTYNPPTLTPDRQLDFAVEELTAATQTGTGMTVGSIKVVTEDNALPVIYLSGIPLPSGVDYSTAFIEDDGSVTVLSSNVRVTRAAPDSVPPTFRQITIELTNGVDANEYLLASSSECDITVQGNGTSSVVIEGPGDSGDFVCVLTTVMYINTNDRPTTSFNRTIEFTVNDTEGRLNSPLAISTIEVIAVNDPPIMTLSNNGAETTQTVEYNEGSPTGVTLAPQVTVLDVDNDNVEGAEVILESPNLSEDSLQLDSTPAGLTWTYNASTGELSITGTAPLSTYEAALRNITFESNDSPFLDNEGEPVDPTDRTATFRVFDGEAYSDAVTVTIAFQPVDDPPRILGLPNVVGYTDGDPPLLIAASAIIVDDDNVQLRLMEVTLVTPAESDALTYDTTSGLSLTFFEDSLNNFMQILQAITFVNTAPELSLIDRRIEIMVCDFTACTVGNVSIRVTDSNDNTPEFESPDYSYDVAEDITVGTLIDTLQVTDADDRETITTTFQYRFEPSSIPIRLESIGAGDRIQVIVNEELDAESTALYEFVIYVSDGSNEGSTNVSITVTNVNEAPVISLDTSSATIVGSPNSDTQLLQVGFSINDPDVGDAVERARLTIRNIPTDSNETLIFSPELDGFSFSEESSQFELEVTNSTVANDSLEVALRNIFYAAGSEVTETTVLRFVDISVLDGGGLESEPITVNVSLASIPVFSMATYNLSLTEGIVHLNFFQVEASVESGGDVINYDIEQGVGVSIDTNTGFLSLTQLLDREVMETLSFKVFAIDSLPPARTGTATVYIAVLDVNDVRPDVTFDQPNITITTGVSVDLLPDVTVTDPDISSDIIYATVTAIGQRDLIASPFTGEVCVDEYNVIDKMVEVCGLVDFIDVLENNDTSSGTTLQEDSFGNRILTNTDQGYTTISTSFPSSGGIISELTTAFWIRPEESGYLIYIGTTDALERYWTIYYDKDTNQLIVTMKRADISGLQAQVRVIFQLDSPLDDGDWHFVMIQYSNRDLLCAVDAERVQSMAVVYKEEPFIGEVFGELTLMSV